MSPLSCRVPIHLATALHPSPPICCGRSCIRTLSHPFFLRRPPYPFCMMMLTRLRGGGGRPAYYRCTSTRGTWMLSPGVSEGSVGERRDAGGRVGRCGAAPEVDASVHRYGWWWARLLSSFLPHRSAWSHLISCCLAALLNCFGCACHCVIRRCYGFSGWGIDQTRIGSSSNASTV